MEKLEFKMAVTGDPNKTHLREQMRLARSYINAVCGLSYKDMAKMEFSKWKIAMRIAHLMSDFAKIPPPRKMCLIEIALLRLEHIFNTNGLTAQVPILTKLQRLPLTYSEDFHLIKYVFKRREKRGAVIDGIRYSIYWDKPLPIPRTIRHADVIVKNQEWFLTIHPVNKGFLFIDQVPERERQDLVNTSYFSNTSPK